MDDRELEKTINDKIRNMNKKPFWQSKTFWVNLATYGLTAATDIENPEHVVMGLAIANIFLRVLTKQPISLQ